MFARFKKTGEPPVNLNVSLVRDFAPHSDTETKINFLGGDSMIVPFSEQAVNGAFRRALAPKENTESQ